MQLQLEKHHKIIIGGLGSLVILFMVISSIFMYLLFIKHNEDYNILNQKIDSLENDTTIRINDLSENLIETKTELNSLGLQIGSIDVQITKLKASVSSDFSGIIESAIKSVVTIKTNVAQGSGFFIASDGYIVTNAHVMKDATSATVITYDGQTHQVSKIGENPEMDIILLKITTKSYKPLSLGDSSKVKQGEPVVTIGNPYGLSFSASQGIISNIHQEGPNGLDAYLQIDAALNPGNSGGPLIDKNGEVVGINNFKLSEAEGLGFALESNYIKEIVNDIATQAYGENLV